MVAYSFKGRFEDRIRAKTKIQTIRAVGKKRHTRPGERMTMTTGDRFHPRPIGSGTCEAVAPITLNFEMTTPAGRRKAAHVVVGLPAGGNMVIRAGDLDDFARRDGFDDWADLCAFWRQTHGELKTFDGLLILWGDSFQAAS